ncbi:MAG TPA: hypothetical protein VF247_11910 [Candidatus Krumholzibacteria bacterium]
MKLRNGFVVVLAAVFVMAATGAFAQNVLVNPGFESGLSGWTPFGNVYPEGPAWPFIPNSGNGLVSMFGNWWGVFNVSGMFQEFPASPGDTWEMSSFASFCSCDPMVGVGAPNNNWVVQKIAWFDASNTEIGGVESTILDATFAADVWHGSGTISGVAPAGTVKLQALILYLQPLYDGGAAHIDDVSLVHVQPVKAQSSTWGQVKALYR